jgi:hypothetical protein
LSIREEHANGSEDLGVLSSTLMYVFSKIKVSWTLACMKKESIIFPSRISIAINADLSRSRANSPRGYAKNTQGDRRSLGHLQENVEVVPCAMSRRIRHS